MKRRSRETAGDVQLRGETAVAVRVRRAVGADQETEQAEKACGVGRRRRAPERDLVREAVEPEDVEEGPPHFSKVERLAAVAPVQRPVLEIDSLNGRGRS